MKIILYILLISCLNLTIISCSKKDETTTSPQNVTLLGRSDGKGVDLVITGDGFKLDQIDTFHTAAQNIMDFIFDHSDNISKHKSGWNVHRLDAISDTDCIDYSTEDNVSCSTESAYGAYYWCGGIERLPCINTSTVTSKVLAVYPQYDNVIILVLVFCNCFVYLFFLIASCPITVTKCLILCFNEKCSPILEHSPIQKL